MQSNKGRKKREYAGADADGTVSMVSRSFFTSLVLSVLILLSLSAICYTTKDPMRYVDITAMAALFLSSMVSGIVSAVFSGDDYMKVSLITGALLSVVSIVMSLCFDSVRNILFAFLIYAAEIALNIVSAHFTNKIKSSSGRRRRYR